MEHKRIVEQPLSTSIMCQSFKISMGSLEFPMVEMQDHAQVISLINLVLMQEKYNNILQD